MQIKDNQKIIDSIMANVDKWNFSPYKAQTQMGGNLSLGNKSPFQGGLSLSGGGELDHNPFKNKLFGQKLNLGQNNLSLQTQNGYQMPAPVNQGGLGGLKPLAQPNQNGLANPYQMPKINPNALNTSHESAHTQPLSFWDKTKNFAGSQSGRALIATGLTGALTAAFGGSPLEALSYGAQSGGKASDVYSNRLNKQDKLRQDQDELRQKAFDNEQSRQLRMDQILTNAELNKTMAEIKYQNALGLEDHKAGIADKVAVRNRGHEVEDRDFTATTQEESQQRGFEHDKTMAGVNSGYDIEKSKQAINNQMQMAVFNGDIDRALAIHQMGLDIEKNSKMKQEEARISTVQPTEKMKNYDYFMEKNEPNLARGIVRGDGYPVQNSYKDSERLAANFANRMVESAKILDEYENEGGNAFGAGEDKGFGSFMGKTLGSLVPDVLGGNNFERVFSSDKKNQYDSAAENWLSANLRKESGAAIPPSEIEQEKKKYFPQIGDSKDTIDMKRKLRKAAEKGMLFQAGHAYDALVGNNATLSQSNASMSQQSLAQQSQNDPLGIR